MVGVVTQPFPVCDCQTDRSFLKTGSGRRRKYLFPTTSENPGCPLVLAPPSSASGAHCLPLVYRWLTTSCVLSTPAYDWRFSCGVTSISGRHVEPQKPGRCTGWPWLTTACPEGSPVPRRGRGTVGTAAENRPVTHRRAPCRCTDFAGSRSCRRAAKPDC